MLAIQPTRTCLSSVTAGLLARFAIAIAVGICTVVTNTNVYAAGTYSGTIQSVLAYGSNTNVLFVNVNGTAGQTPPSCATQNYRFTVNPATDAGKATIAVVLSALARGATVWIQGTGTCDIWPDTESILAPRTT